MAEPLAVAGEEPLMEVAAEVGAGEEAPAAVVDAATGAAVAVAAQAQTFVAALWAARATETSPHALTTQSWAACAIAVGWKPEHWQEKSYCPQLTPAAAELRQLTYNKIRGKFQDKDVRFDILRNLVLEKQPLSIG